MMEHVAGPNPDASVTVGIAGRLGRITLNRPAALNALNLEMIRDLHRSLEAFASDPRVEIVVVDGAGNRGLCAGGDIAALRESALKGTSYAADFFAEEYRLNAFVNEFPKPYVAYMDGIVMGGGVGISAHARHRVSTDRLRLAMPEVGIGFTPDVGGSWLLSRCPGESGTRLALTGQSISSTSAMAMGIADVAIDHTSKELLMSRLQSSTPEDTFADLASASPAGAEPSTDVGAWIDDCYGPATVSEILRRLDGCSEPQAAQDASTIRRHSPTSLVTTLASLRRASTLTSLRDCLEQEFRLATQLIRTHDFAEGVRAAVIDKDRNPQWLPESLSRVDPALVASLEGSPRVF